MQIENNYDKLKEVAEETSPLPKDPIDIPTRAIDTELYENIEDKAQIEAEIDIEKHGVPIIDVERPPIPKVQTDPTPYRKIEVTRKEKKSDKMIEIPEPITLDEDREMKAFAEKLSIPKRKSLLVRLRKKLYDLSCKIKKFAFNTISKVKRKMIKVGPHTHDEHVLPANIKRVALRFADDGRGESLGRVRGFQRPQDESSSVMQMVRNKKTGVVVATPSLSAYKASLEDGNGKIDDYEVVESQIKDRYENSKAINR